MPDSPRAPRVADAPAPSSRWPEPGDDVLRGFLGLPELALVAESCAAETALHRALEAEPRRPVAACELDALRDADARANYATFLAFRDALLGAGSLEGYYLALMRSGRVDVPPVFVERIVEAIVRDLVDAGADAFEARAAELLYRPQRITRADGRMLGADLRSADLLNETAGLGDLGRLLVQGRVPMPALDLPVLAPELAADYWRERDRHRFVLDLTHEIERDVGHGLAFTLTRAHSGLKALARVLEAWVRRLLGVEVAITPLARIDDAHWRWHVGLDVDSMALLNDLYGEREVDPDRMAQLISLFRLDFADPAEMRADVAGMPVYLGLATAADGTLRLKPQNLLLNLPLAPRM